MFFPLLLGYSKSIGDVNLEAELAEKAIEVINGKDTKPRQVVDIAEVAAN